LTEIGKIRQILLGLYSRNKNSIKIFSELLELLNLDGQTDRQRERERERRYGVRHVFAVSDNKALTRL